MKRLIRWLGMAVLCAVLAAVLTLPVCAQQEKATELFWQTDVQVQTNMAALNSMFDGQYGWYLPVPRWSWFTLQSQQPIGSVYLVFDHEPGIYTLTDEDTEKTVECGSNGFLRDYLDITELFGENVCNLKLSFPNSEAQIYEVRMFTAGEVPADVQKWKAPKDGNIDLMLFSTHADDEQLFFAGILPYYAGELDYEVLVVYLTDHRNQSNIRIQELLNGLWAVGVTNYPVIGSFPDFYSMDKTESFTVYENNGCSREMMTGYIVEQLRRYKPLVAVGHDVNGEYGHGAHMMYTELLIGALELENDARWFPESSEEYGVWETPKTYIHLLPNAQIEMNWDRPLSKFNGMTAYEVSRDLGFGAHMSQQKDFEWYYKGHATAASIPEYSPCDYGLYRSTAGEDVRGGDFFENLETRGQALAREEEARRHAEEAERAAQTAPAELTVPETTVQMTQAAEPVPENVSRQTDHSEVLMAVILGAAAVISAVFFMLRKKFLIF